MRCLTLADALRELGAQCLFICRQEPGNLVDFIRQRGHEVRSLPSVTVPLGNLVGPAHASWLGTAWDTDARQTRDALYGTVFDWLVVDHYALDMQWEKVLRESCHYLMVIDDLADRPHVCDLLLDQNFGRAEQDYQDLVSTSCQLLLGPIHALLRSDFAQWRRPSLLRRSGTDVRQILVFLGGVDEFNITGQVLACLSKCELNPESVITVVLGLNAPGRTQVEQVVEKMPWPTRLLTGVNNMAELMTNSDVAIGSAGGAAWERCCLGLPSLLLVLARNQQQGTEALGKAGAAFVIGTPGEIPARLDVGMRLMEDSRARGRMSQRAAKITDGAGVGRVCKAMEGLRG
jgi:UDP-2,4-diacetamido-2,4,6-trideoxy-beta-L-altropyranose hydrolase